jgi:hypothetical protein
MNDDVIRLPVSTHESIVSESSEVALMKVKALAQFVKVQNVNVALIGIFDVTRVSEMPLPLDL